MPWACGNYREVAFDLQVIQHLHSDMDNLIKQEPPEKKFTAYCAGHDCPGAMRIRWTTRLARCPDCHTAYGQTELRALNTEYGANPQRETSAA